MDFDGGFGSSMRGVNDSLAERRSLLSVGREDSRAGGSSVRPSVASPFFSCPFSCALVSCITIMVVGIVGLFAENTVRDAIVRKYVVVSSEDSPLFDVFQNPLNRGIRQVRKFTVMNLTNHAEVLGGAAPNFELVGPYCFDEITAKSDIRFTDDGNQVRYKYSSVFVFNPTCSGNASADSGANGPDVKPYPHNDPSRTLSDEDEFIFQNLAVSGLGYRIDRLPDKVDGVDKSTLCYLLDMLFSKSSLGPYAMFSRYRLKDVLYGAPAPLFEEVNPLLADFQYTAGTLLTTQWNGSLVVPSPYSYRAGQKCPIWANYTTECNTTGNMDTVEHTGLDDYRKLGRLSQWAGQTLLWWHGALVDGYDSGVGPVPFPVVAAPSGPEPAPFDARCPNFVAGTSGVRWGPIDVVHRQQRLEAFTDIMLRSIHFAYEADTTVKGVAAQRFGLPPDVIGNTSDNQFCFQQEHYGLFNFSRLLFGEIYGTKSWMLDVPAVDVNGSDVAQWVNFTIQTRGGARVPFREYRAAVLGASTDPDAFRRRFDSYVAVEPLTGVTLHAEVHGMVFTMMRPFRVSGCEAVPFAASLAMPTGLYPIALMDKAVIIPDSLADELADKLQDVHMFGELIIACVVAGPLCAIAALAVRYVYRLRLQKKLEAELGYVE